MIPAAALSDEEQGALRRLRYGLALAGLVVAAFLVRAGAFSQLGRTPFGRHLLADESVYAEWASLFAQGERFPPGPYEFPPLPAFAFALAYRLFGAGPDVLRHLNIGLGVLACALVALIARRAGGRIAALAALALVAFAGPLVLHSAVALKTSLLVALMAAFTLCALSALERATLLRCALLGVALGALLSTQGHAVLLVPLGLWLAWDARQRTGRAARVGAVLLGLLCALSPALLHGARENVLSPLPTQAGFNLYLGSVCDAPSPYLSPVPFAVQTPRLQSVGFLVEAERRTAAPQTAQSTSRYWTWEALREVARHPVGCARHFAAKAGAAVASSEVGDHYSLTYLRRRSPALASAFVGFGLLFALAGVGVFCGVRGRRSRLLLSIALCWAASLALFLPGARYRAPLFVALAPLAGAGVEAAWLAWRRGDRRALLRALGVASLLGALSWGLGAIFVDDETGALNTEATLLFAEGDDDGALERWALSARRRGRMSEWAELALARHALLRGDLEEASARLATPPAGRATLAERNALQSALAYRRGDRQGAIAAARASLAVNGCQLSVHRALARLLEEARDPQARAARDELHRVEDIYRREAPFAASLLKVAPPDAALLDDAAPFLTPPPTETARP